MVNSKPGTENTISDASYFTMSLCKANENLREQGNQQLSLSPRYACQLW